MKLLCLTLTLILAGCSTQGPALQQPVGPILRISELNPNKGTALTRQNLEQLTQVYDVSPLIFSTEINIQSGVMAKSHPVLTLNTRFAENPNKILAAFLHEQFHWWMEKNKKSLPQVNKDMKKVIPALPKHATYQHVLICYLEHEALVHYLGKKEARKILMSFIQREKIHPWLYTQALNKSKNLSRIAQKYKLKPKPLR